MDEHRKAKLRSDDLDLQLGFWLKNIPYVWVPGKTVETCNRYYIFHGNKENLTIFLENNPMSGEHHTNIKPLDMNPLTPSFSLFSFGKHPETDCKMVRNCFGVWVYDLNLYDIGGPRMEGIRLSSSPISAKVPKKFVIINPSTNYKKEIYLNPEDNPEMIKAEKIKWWEKDEEEEVNRVIDEGEYVDYKGNQVYTYEDVGNRKGVLKSVRHRRNSKCAECGDKNTKLRDGLCKKCDIANSNPIRVTKKEIYNLDDPKEFDMGKVIWWERDEKKARKRLADKGEYTMYKGDQVYTFQDTDDGNVIEKHAGLRRESKCAECGDKNVKLHKGLCKKCDIKPKS